MLSIKKTRIHGLQDERWTTKDKLTQFKGLITLYKRDRAITDKDTNVERKKQVRDIKTLKKDIKSNRSKLKNAILGDRQQLRNSLAAHKDMQLAYQNLHPLEVIDHIHQDNFTRRKKFDLLTYEMKHNARRLTDLKLKHSVLEDELKYETLIEFPTEKICQIVTGKVQDAILRKEAALVVKQTYLNIISIMKKDSMYYDAVLGAVYHDGKYQGRCLLSATQMGQLATEYLDDRKTEFQALEKCVKRDMKARLAHLNQVRIESERKSRVIKTLIRRDDDINVGKITIPSTAEDTKLSNDVRKLEEVLFELKIVTQVVQVEQIYPCMEEQAKQKKRLNNFSQKAESSRDSLLNRLNHARTMHNQLLYTMNETTFEYQKEKQRLLKEIEKQKTRKKHTENLIQNVDQLLAKVDYCLHNLFEISKIIYNKTPPKKRVPSQVYMASIPIPDFTTINDPDIITNLTKLLSKLSPVLAMKPEQKEHSINYFENLIRTQTKSIHMASVTSELDDFDDLFEVHVASHILTRDDIKAQSVEIVKQHEISDDVLPVVVPKKKYKF